MNQTPKNKSLDGLYRAVGSAISNWTRIEIQLHQLFTICLSFIPMQCGGGFSVNAPAPGAVLDAIDGFRGRLLMIDAAIEAALGALDTEATAILNDWAIERKKINILHGNRNALAHWSASRHTNRDGSTKEVRLEPPYYSSDDHQGVRETDIQQWEQCFTEASYRLAVLVERLASHQGLQRKHLEQVASQIRCTYLTDPTLREFLIQQLSEHP